MLRFYDIGQYIYAASRDPDHYRLYTSSTPPDHDRIESYDHMLHKSLEKIFRERCRSSSEQFKKFLRDPQRNTDYNSIIEPILDQEPVLSEHFSEEELGKLSLLWIAVLAGYTDSAELLVRSGADVNELFGRHDPQVIDENWTILHLLLRMDPSPENKQLISLVTDHGADLQARDYRGQTVLHIAVISSRVRITKMLLEKGADVDAADNTGMTPLLFAASNIKANELVPLLMEHGADVLAKSNCGQNALHRLTYFSVDTVDLARLLIKKGVSIEDRERDYRYQPIHRAAMHANYKLVKLFLDHGAYVNARAKCRQSPLYFAARCHRGYKVVETLLNHGAKIYQTTIGRFGGKTALHAACKYAASASLFTTKDESCEITIRLLLCAGADVLAKDNAGKTPFALISSRANETQPGKESWPLIEMLALKKVFQPSIELKDERIIERYPALQDYYRKYVTEYHGLKSMRIIETCTFSQLLRKRQCQLAALMRNPEFEAQFRRSDIKDRFPILFKNILRAFECAKDLGRSMSEQENVINEAVYNIFPDVVMRKMVHYMSSCCVYEECENIGEIFLGLSGYT